MAHTWNITFLEKESDRFGIMNIRGRYNPVQHLTIAVWKRTTLVQPFRLKNQYSYGVEYIENELAV